MGVGERAGNDPTSLSSLAFGINVSIISHKGFGSNTLKPSGYHSQGKLAHAVSLACREIKGLFLHQRLRFAFTCLFSVTLTCDWLAVA